jgi:hypothetical protein
VQAHHGEAALGVFITHGVERFHAGDIDVRQEELVYARIHGAAHHFLAVLVELLVVEVRVRVDVHSQVLCPPQN